MHFSLKEDGKRIVLCILGGIIMAVNLRTFVHAGGLLPGGVTGLSLLLQNIFSTYFSIHIPYAPLYLGLNLVPAAICYRTIGRKFVLYSCVVFATVALLTSVLPAGTVTDDILLISVFGGIVNGLSVVICLLGKATSGGTDFISIYISEKYDKDAWNYILGFNAVILMINGYLFGWDKALYSIIFQFVSTQTLNTLYRHYKKSTLIVVSDHTDEIAGKIHELTRHGATILEGKGSYEKEDRKILYSVIGRDEVAKILKCIREIDPKAFTNTINTQMLEGHFNHEIRD